MLTLSTLKKALIPRQIETAEEFQKLLKSKHEQVKIFGMKFNPKYLIQQDTFDKATSNQSQITIPQHLHLILQGITRPRLKVNVEPNSSFKNIVPPPQDIYEGILGGKLST